MVPRIHFHIFLVDSDSTHFSVIIEILLLKLLHRHELYIQENQYMYGWVILSMVKVYIFFSILQASFLRTKIIR